MHRAFVAAAVLLAACGTASSQPATTPPPFQPPPDSSPAVFPNADPTFRDVSEPDNGTTVTLRTGGTLRAVLHSTYWQFDPPSDPTVLGSTGQPVYSPAPRGQCVPGGGCGTVTATFQALRPGRAVVSAHRTSCGEALRCTGNQGSWMVTVVVSG